ncbi:metal ABC transporter solute-binding protein, Zn/Mn family [Achromobacter sp. NFACC18-2]|uniref:metal ABC transporter solute-binding protein, Zn/Mn family n=1 Tax=Achromobacter sp. NFACC18-2 TaxID=1564112 RepID=UPI0008C953E3|nr:zinc ABC transporter substrate-binding protein [Achromobacter sp. NFACC18-2]SEI48321.1 ABC-type Zn uptake system ZnuABC, Zn-binding component ZnuA [Achromobacter sp. NFACC18-2]
MSVKSGYVTLRRAALALAVASTLGAALTAHAQEAATTGRAARAAQAQAQAPAAGSAAAATPAAATVLAAHPVVFALTSNLARDTHIRVERAAPANLPPTRLSSYFSGRGGAALHKAAASADAAVGLRSIWPDDPLYPNARRANIRIIEIDAARPLDGALNGIALQRDARPGGQFSAYPWLSIVNLGRMADIVAADLGRLSPADEKRIADNLAQIKRTLVELNAKSQAGLAQAENVAVISLSERLPYLIAEFNLDLIDTDARDDRDWTPQALAELTAKLKDNGAAAALLHREPTPELRQAIEAGGAQAVVLATEGADPIADLQDNAQRLLQALAPAAAATASK